MSVNGSIIRKDVYEGNKCVTETWIRENFDDRVKEWFPLKNGNLKVNLESDEGLDDYDKAKLIKTMPTHLGNFILSPSKRFMNDLISQIVGFYYNSIYYTDTDSPYKHKKNGVT